MNTYRFLETFFNGSTNFRVLIARESDRATLLDFEISKLQKIFFTNATKEMASIYNAPICWANFYNGDLFVVVDLEED